MKPKLSELPNDTSLILDEYTSMTAEELKDDILRYGREAHKQTWHIGMVGKWEPDATKMFDWYIDNESDTMYEDWSDRVKSCVFQFDLIKKMQSLLDECLNHEYTAVYLTYGLAIEIDIFPPNKEDSE